MNRMNRRTALKGLGGITIGLPLLEEMTLAAKAKAVPVRAFNVFFGLGVPAPLQTEGFGGVLEPLKPLRKKLLIMRQVDQVRCDISGINAHYDGATGSFTAMPAGGSAKAKKLLDNWSAELGNFRKVMPRDYQRALKALEDEREQAAMEAAE